MVGFFKTVLSLPHGDHPCLQTQNFLWWIPPRQSKTPWPCKHRPSKHCFLHAPLHDSFVFQHFHAQISPLLHLSCSFTFLFCGFWGQGFLKGSVPFSTSRRASLMEIFQFSILDCSKLSQVRGLGRILLFFIYQASKITIY